MQTFVIFDLDGTLYDLYQPFQIASQRVLEEMIPSDEQLKNIFLASRTFSDELRAQGYNDTKELVFLRNRLAFAKYGIHLSDATHRELQSAYLFFQQHLQMESDMEDLLAILLNHGVRLALISNGETKHQSEKARALKLERFIVKERQFFSGMIGIDKPDVRLFRWVEERLAIQSEDRIIYVGDSYAADMVGAHQAGWSSVWSRVYTNEASKGDSKDADAIVYDLFTLKQTLLRMCEEKRG